MTRKAFFAALLVCVLWVPSGIAGNDPMYDPTVISIYRLEQNFNDFFGNNNFAETSAPAYESSSPDPFEGTYSADFGGTAYGSLAVGSCSSDMPAKSAGGDISICVRYYLNSGGSKSRGVVSAWNATGNDRGWILYIDSAEKMNLGIGNGGATGTFVTHATALSTGEWYSVCASYDITTQDGYVRVYNASGVEVGSTASNTSMAVMGPFEGTLYIGTANAAALDKPLANLDELWIWPRVLSATEMAAWAAGTFGVTMYSSGDYDALPASATAYDSSFELIDYYNVGLDNDTYVSQTGQTGQLIIGYLLGAVNSNDSDYIYPSITLKSSKAPSAATVTLELYDDNGTTWEAMSTESSAAADTEFVLYGSKETGTLANYYNANNKAYARVYQTGDDGTQIDVEKVQIAFGFASDDDFRITTSGGGLPIFNTVPSRIFGGHVIK